MKNEWQTEPLGDLCEFQRGLTYAKGDEVEVSDNVVLRATNIDLMTNLLDFSELKYINDKVVVPDSKKVKKGSLMICTASGSKSHLGKVAYIDDDYGYAFGGFMGMITPKNGLVPKYLFHLMTSDAYKNFIGELSDGANINNLKFDDLKKFQVPYPNRPEQQRIVGILDEAFDGIATAKANAEQNLQNTREIFGSALTEALRGNRDDWDSRELDSLLLEGRKISYGIVKPGRHDPDGVRLIKSQQVRDDSMDLSADFRITKELDLEYARTRLQGGEILLNLVGASIGRSAIAPKALRGANVSRAIAVIPVLPELSVWIQYNLRGSVGQKLIQSKTGGSAQPVLNLSEVRSLTIPFPPLDEQQAIIKKLDVLAAETQRLASLYERKLVALEALKKSLLHQAFTGQLGAQAA